jgi:arylsulfatase A-like enzyme
MKHTFTRRQFLEVAAGGTAAATFGNAAAQQRRPNVLFILADDLGYGDLSCYGRPDYQTPVLDRLARQGIKFMSAYAAAPLCTPTRCAFHTGRYPQRLEVGLREPLTQENGADIGLPADHPTISSLMKRAGYDTALIGKWHLGWKPEFGPNRHGFDEFFGILSGAADYFTHKASDAPGNHGPDGGADLWDNVAPIERVGYLTDLLSAKAAEFVTRRRSNPFYLSLHYTAPHSPWEGPEDAAIGHGEHGQGPMVEGGSLKIYAAMMQSMDAGIGRVLDALRRAGAERNTLVIFTSDNGGERYSFNWPFSFQKGFLWEGGIRVPAIVRWPGVVPAGRSTEQVAITMDWTATILSAAGATVDPRYTLDGEDLLSVCTGTKPEYDRMLFWRTQARDAARIGRLKYLNDGTGERLFDLGTDPGEKVDLRPMNAGMFARIRAEYEGWNARMLPRTAA